MGKRVPPDDKPYRPVDEALIRSVLNPELARAARLAEGEQQQPPPPAIDEPPAVRVADPEAQAEPADSLMILNGHAANGSVYAQEAQPDAPTPPQVNFSPPAPPNRGFKEPKHPRKLKIEVPEIERLTREKRVLMSPSEDRDIERLVTDMGEALGTTLKTSHMLRAIIAVVQHSREELVRQSKKRSAMRRPANSDPAALASFEHGLAQLIQVAIKNTKALE